MAYTIEFNESLTIIEVRLQGIILLEEIREMISQCTCFAKQHQCYLWLSDYSKATPQLSTLEIYELPKLFVAAASALEIHVFHIKRAIVMSEVHSDYPFAQTVSKNRGQSLELFWNLKDARDWLLK